MRVCRKQGMVSTIVVGMVGMVCCMVFETLKNVVKQKSMYFVICPKQGPYMEGVVLHSVGF